MTEKVTIVVDQYLKFMGQGMKVSYYIVWKVIWASIARPSWSTNTHEMRGVHMLKTRGYKKN